MDSLRSPRPRRSVGRSGWVRAGSLLAALAVVLGTAVAVTPSAAARTSLDAVAAALRTSPVFVEPGNQAGITGSDAEQLLADVRAAGTPIYVAVLSAESLGGTNIRDATRQIGDAVGIKAAYAVVAGRQFYADSTLFPVGDLADQALAENRSQGAMAILEAFIADVSARAAEGGTTGGSAGGGSPWVGLVVLLVLLGGGAALVVVLVRRSRRTTARRLAEVRQVIDEDVTQFGEALGAFDLTDPDLDDAGRAELQTALTAYDRAKAAADAMRSPADAASVTGPLEDGRYALACVQARVSGQPLPQRRPPCFVDPRHGPSVQDVVWAPDGGAPRPVPVCAACATTLAAGGLPAAREVPSGAGGGRVPYWRAGGQYAPYAGGYYSSFGDILPALFVGTMLASAFHQPTVVVDHQDTAAGGWQGGGGDSGGGGWFGGGGGDFGGGGGDFGGGGGGGDF